jgi:hypothetical protein
VTEWATSITTARNKNATITRGATLGWRVTDDKQAKLLELAELELEVKERQAKMKKIRAEI